MIGRELYELALLFLKLGTFGFGGLPTQVAMMNEEVVTRRRWLTQEQFLDLVGTTNLIPGPNSVEIAAHVGYLRAAWIGFVVAGCAFILPSALIAMAFAWLYVQFGTLPSVMALFYGIKPAVLAVIAIAVWRLGRSAMKNEYLALIGSLVLLAALLQINEAVVILAGGVGGMLWLRFLQRKRRRAVARSGFLLWDVMSFSTSAKLPGVLSALPLAAATVPPSLWELALFFAKVGAVLFGSGYVLVAFLSGLITDYQWLTQQELLDSVAIGQFTPGPFLSTATFIGYLLLGVPGAIVATVAIFLPSFIFAALLSPLIPRLRRSPWTAALLDALNVSSVALMLAVAFELAQTTLTSWPAWVIGLGALAVGLRWKINATWLIVGGALLGLLLVATGQVTL